MQSTPKRIFQRNDEYRQRHVAIVIFFGGDGPSRQKVGSSEGVVEETVAVVVVAGVIEFGVSVRMTAMVVMNPVTWIGGLSVPHAQTKVVVFCGTTVIIVISIISVVRKMILPSRVVNVGINRITKEPMKFLLSRMC